MNDLMGVNFATGNKYKVKEANLVGKGFGIKFIQLKEEYPEIRDEAVEEVAKEGVRFVFRNVNTPVIVEDAGLYISPLHGFPGSYSAFVFRKIGNQGILDLLKDFQDRSAQFVCAVAYCDSSKPIVFRGLVEGEISRTPAGNGGFGYDPIFIPKSHRKTFAQDPELKSRVSHRMMAFEKFCQWLKAR